MGLSIGKLLVVAAIAWAVWYVTKHPGLIEAVTRAARLELGGRRRPRPASGPPLAAQDLTKCERCGAYTAAACARSDCPRKR